MTMRIRKRGAIAVVDAVVGFGLLVLDAWGRESQVAVLIPRSLTPFLPVAYGICFLTALLLMRGEYESADYEFYYDPVMKFVYQSFGSMGFSEIYRVSIRNYGHAPITAQVVIRAISPEPAGYSGRFGMPLIPVGEPQTSEPMQINPKIPQAFNLVEYRNVLGSPDDLKLWHGWTMVTHTLPARDYTTRSMIDYEFELEITLAEGSPKTARYLLRPCATPPPHGGASWGYYELTLIKPRKLWSRLLWRARRGVSAHT